MTEYSLSLRKNSKIPLKTLNFSNNMKKAIKFITAFALLLVFASCNKSNDITSKPVNARYEVTTIDGNPEEAQLVYITQDRVGYGNGLQTKTENVITPWQHEFIAYTPFNFTVYCNSNNNSNHKTGYIVRLYVNDELLTEREGENYVHLNYILTE